MLSFFRSNEGPDSCSLPSDIDSLSDDEILKLQRNSSKLLPEYFIYKLTPGTVSKLSKDADEDPLDASEANAVNLVSTMTTIPVPRVCRVVKRSWDYLLVMDYIKGRPLSEAWKDLSTWQKLSVAFTLRRCVRQLRRLKASPTMPPGPLSAYGPPLCDSPIFGEIQTTRGPFSSYAEFTQFMNERHNMALDIDDLPDDHASRRDLLDTSEPLVFTHQDLNPRNIILGEDGRVWIVDWAWAGFYPLCFEYVAMQRQANNEVLLGYRHVLWEVLIPFICGLYFKQDKWLWNTSRGLAFI
ncbi:hypothetical protein CERSUDRAFT_124110 [Gelatoporia subvermispora B]|uniref:Aminoglycoside phosphotransferase domain-containing protein n=1 Tax=Ceriporiopsis subvermispora (strain B) TaxID=914234 RepID=M2QYB1_CERS8|nr:hypothetical protein CERSUDRAFT_124110 [Gelatoporia subvermispora B]